MGHATMCIPTRKIERTTGLDWEAPQNSPEPDSLSPRAANQDHYTSVRVPGLH